MTVYIQYHFVLVSDAQHSSQITTHSTEFTHPAPHKVIMTLWTILQNSHRDVAAAWGIWSIVHRVVWGIMGSGALEHLVQIPDLRTSQHENLNNQQVN